MGNISKSSKKSIIGRLEKVDLPDFELFNLSAKIDTGAYGNSIHCNHIEIVNEGKLSILHFELLDPSHPEYQNRVYKSEYFKQKIVKSSTGHEEVRFVIKTKISLYDKTWKTEFSLTDRQSMKFPILIGRKFLRNKFIVDVSKKYLGKL